jgi:hypothetical protein
MEHSTARAVAGWINKLLKEISPQIPNINPPLITLLKIGGVPELYFNDESRKPSYMVTCHMLLSKFDL